MKSLKALTVVLVAALTMGMAACGSSGGGGNDPIFTFISALSARQGPNQNVVEPYQGVSSNVSGNFFTEANPATRASTVIQAILLTTNPGASSNAGVPNDSILAALSLGFDMGNIAADPGITTAQACPAWDDGAGGGEFWLNMVGAATLAATTNCAITSQSSGQLALTFGTAADASYGLFANGPQTGSLSIYGEIRTPLYPGYDPAALGIDCVQTGGTQECRDVWVTAFTNNLGSDIDDITANSAISGYIFNYDLDDLTPDLASLPLFIVANLQITNTTIITPTNVAVLLGLPTGLGGAATNYFSSVIDADGRMWGFGYGNLGGVMGDTIYIASMPIQADGMVCLSVFISAAGPSENQTAYVYNVAASDSCGY